MQPSNGRMQRLVQDEAIDLNRRAAALWRDMQATGNTPEGIAEANQLMGMASALCAVERLLQGNTSPLLLLHRAIR